MEENGFWSYLLRMAAMEKGCVVFICFFPLLSSALVPIPFVVNGVIVLMTNLSDDPFTSQFSGTSLDVLFKRNSIFRYQIQIELDA